MSEKSSPVQRGVVQSVVRSFDILEVIAESGPDVGITEIAAEVNLPLPTIHRLLQTMISTGYVYQTPRRRYALGARLIPLSRYAGGALGIALRPLLTHTVERVGESASVAMLSQDYARYIAHVPSERSLRMFMEIGNQVSLHASGVGKAILSKMPPDEARAVLQRTGLRRFTDATITSPDVLLRELERIQQLGFAEDNGEHETGVKCVAVPIPGPMYLAASVSGPPERLNEEFVHATLLPEMTKLAERIAQEISLTS